MYRSRSARINQLKGLLVTILLLSMLLTGCGPKTAVKSAEATQEPAATQTPAPTNTPQPTSTNTLVPTDTPTPTATATLTATATPDRKATAMTARTATAEALIEKIKPDLEIYGYKPEDGHLAWSSDEEYILEANSYGAIRYHPLDDLGAISNFIVQSKVEWDTSGALAGCGFIFRAEEDINEGKHHQFYMIRLQNAPAWTIEFVQFGRYQSSLVKGVFSNHINDKNGTSNVITLVVNGRNITPYINGEKERTIEDVKLKEGLIALMTIQESGSTTCTFNDTWVWAIDKEE